MPTSTSIKKLLKGLALTSAAGVGGYGGYHIGNYVGIKKTQNEINESLNNQQIANEYYIRGLQENSMNKTAQQIASELLKKANQTSEPVVMEKKASNQTLDTIRENAYADELQKLGFSFKPMVSALKTGYNAASKGAAKVYNFAKANPKQALAIGGAGMAAGAGGAMAANALTKQSSYKAKIAQSILEKISKA